MSTDTTLTTRRTAESAPTGADEMLAGTIERIEARLPALPAASLRLQRTIIQRSWALACTTVEAARASAKTVAGATAAAAKTVVGTARWSGERTVEAGRVGVKTVWGQGRAQAAGATSVASSEIGSVASSVEGAARRASGVAATAIDAAVEVADADLEPQLDYSHWTKAELYVLAQDLAIDGRSTMNKSELVAALRAAA